MCGIAGILRFDGTSIRDGVLEKFTNAMEHRGPDASGFEFFENRQLGFGHRRLSILDLSEAGKQPMSYADGRYWICYNGEIFNFIDLRKELESKGFTFRTETDTEVVLAAYIAWGKDFLHKLNGMWAMAIWDREEKELFLSRDRFGIKPFYFHFSPDKYLAFASETYAFKHLSEFNRRINVSHAKAQQTDIYALEGRGLSLYEGLYSIMPGHSAVLRMDGSKLNQKRWYDITKVKSNARGKSLEENAKEFYNLFYDACKRRLISDVPVASALSGGLDSSSVYSTVNTIIRDGGTQRVNENSQQAFVATFAGLEVDETKYAKSVVSFVDGKGNYIPHENVNIDLLEKETALYDTLTNRPLYSISSVYRGMKQAGITVSLDGHGVDEMLYGYKDMVYNLYNDALRTRKADTAKSISNVLKLLYHTNSHTELNNRFESELAVMNSTKSRFKGMLKKALLPILKPDVVLRESYAWPNFKEVVGEPYDFSGMEIPDRMVHNEFFQRTLPSLLRNFDFAGMANNIEIRMPFMDYHLVEFVYGLPLEHKIGGGFTKYIVREALKGHLPENVRARTFKVGIGSPWEYWCKNELKEWRGDMLGSQAVKEAKNTLGEDCNDWELINLALIK